MRFKKFTALTLILTLIFTLTACAKDTPTTVDTASTVPTVSVAEPAPEPVHEHDIVSVPNGDGTHTTKCADTDGLACDYEETVETCTFDENYVCTVCGFEHVHELIIAEDVSGNDTQTDSMQHMLTCTADYCDYTEYADCTLDDDWICTECGKNWAYTVEPMEAATKYATINLNVRSIPNKSGELMKELKVNDEVTVVGKVNSFKGEACEFYQLDDGNFADGRYLSDDKVTVSAGTSGGNGGKPATAPNGNVLDWSKPSLNQPNGPYAEAGYVLYEIHDDGGSNIFFYIESFPYVKMGLQYDSSALGRLQRQIDDIWVSRGHSTWSWHCEDMPNGMTKMYIAD